MMCLLGIRGHAGGDPGDFASLVDKGDGQVLLQGVDLFSVEQVESGVIGKNPRRGGLSMLRSE